MIEFIRNKSTGILEAWKSGEKLGDIITMGDRLAKGEDIHAENILNQRNIPSNSSTVGG